MAANPQAPRPTGLTGAAGEYYVAAELSLRGWLATVTIKNAPGTDVLARGLDSGRLVAIQTKTASFRNSFTLNVKDEQPTETDNEWYVLVGLGDVCQRPTFYVIPRNVVAGLIYCQHRHWLATLGRTGVQRRDTPRRMIRPTDVEGYREKWCLLDLPTRDVPLRLDEGIVSVARDYGPSDGNPGWPLLLRRG
jgi:hypothetical protein